jgi:hypothetical protein
VLVVVHVSENAALGGRLEDPPLGALLATPEARILSGLHRHAVNMLRLPSEVQFVAKGLAGIPEFDLTHNPPNEPGFAGFA